MGKLYSIFVILEIDILIKNVIMVWKWKFKIYFYVNNKILNLLIIFKIFYFLVF